MPATSIRKFEPLSKDWRGFAWSTGVFDTARRPTTEAVDGYIVSPHHLILVTLDGGAAYQQVTSACGHRYEGSDRRGAVSFVPANCERHLRLRGVRSEWGSISLNPSIFSDDDGEGPAFDAGAFTNVDDPFLAGVVGEIARLYEADKALDAAYCETMAHATAVYLQRRYGRQDIGPAGAWKLPPWRLRRIGEYVDANLEHEIRIADLAALVGVSEGHLHRAFRITTGKTPLTFITERRVQRAMQMLARGRMSIAEIAISVGFLNPSHFTRMFRKITGRSPSEYRTGVKLGPGKIGRAHV